MGGPRVRRCRDVLREERIVPQKQAEQPVTPVKTDEPTTGLEVPAGGGIVPPALMPEELLTLHRDGSATIHLPDRDIVLPAFTVEQIRGVFVLDDEYPMQAPDDMARDDAALIQCRWLVGLFKLVGVPDPPDLDELPAWTLRPNLRAALTQHWLTVPFR